MFVQVTAKNVGGVFFRYSVFLRGNLLSRHFQCCSLQVKLKLFCTFYICFYDTWSNLTITAMAKFKSCYHKCLKHFFGYLKFSSVTNMLLELGLPSFDTIIHNYSVRFSPYLDTCDLSLIHISEPTRPY